MSSAILDSMKKKVTFSRTQERAVFIKNLSSFVVVDLTQKSGTAVNRRALTHLLVCSFNRLMFF